MKLQSLLDDDGEDLDGDLQVNEDFAARLQHNKEREAWHRLKEKDPALAARIETSAALPDAEEVEARDDAEGSSSDDDEDADLADQEEQRRFLSVLSRIKQRDESIYRPDTQIYTDEEEDDEDDGEADGRPRSSGQQRPARLKDVLARQALEGEAGTSDDGEDARPSVPAAGPSYVEEQEQLRQAFLQVAEEEAAGEGDNAFGGVLRQKRRIVPDASGIAKERDAGQQTQALLDAYFGSNDPLPEDERFLKSYIAQQGWIDRSDEPGGVAVDDIDEDEEYLEAAERFESQYNHRFEEPGPASVITYPRQLEGVVRKKDDRRKQQREAKAARKSVEAAALAEEVKRLKSHKRREMDEQLARVREVSGSQVAERMLAEVLGKGDLDLAEYDRAMEAAFGNSYYEAQDEELGEPNPDVGSDDDAAPELPPVPEIDDHEEATDPEDGGADAAEMGASKAELEKLVDEYHGLDAQDYVGGVACRFRYSEVPATSYGLSILEILALPDKELNQVVGMKRLAPYRDDGGVTRPNYGKLRELQAASSKPLRKKRKAEKPAGTSLWVQREAPAQRVPEQAAASDRDGGAKPGSEKSVKMAGRTAKKQDKADKLQHGAALSNKAAAAVIDRTESRLATYAKPTLSKPAANGMLAKRKKKSKSAISQAATADAAEQHLTKAQRKNLWRQRRREALRSGVPGQ